MEGDDALHALLRALEEAMAGTLVDDELSSGDQADKLLTRGERDQVILSAVVHLHRDAQPGEARPARVAQASEELQRQTALADRPVEHRYLVGDSAFHFTVDDGAIQLHDGRAGDPPSS